MHALIAPDLETDAGIGVVTEIFGPVVNGPGWKHTRAAVTRTAGGDRPHLHYRLRLVLARFRRLSRSGSRQNEGEAESRGNHLNRNRRHDASLPFDGLIRVAEARSQGANTTCPRLFR